MWIYIYNLILIIVLGLLFLALLKGKLTKKMYFVIITCLLSILSGMRGYDVGWDTRNYVFLFSRIQGFPFNNILLGDFGIEKGYVILEYIISIFTTNPTILFLIISFFYMISVGKFIYKNSEEPVMSYILFIALGFFTFSMTALRQTVAIGIILFSYEFIRNRKFMPYLLTVLLASTFHYSALVFLPAYFIAYKKFTKPYIFFTVLTIPTVYIFRDIAFGIVNRISRYEYSTIETQGPITLLLLMITVFIGGIIQIKQVLRKDEGNIFFYNMTFISIILAIMAFIHPVALRAGYYYSIFSIVFIPKIVLSFSNKFLKTIVYCIAIIVLISLYIKGLNSTSPFVPYQFIGIE